MIGRGTDSAVRADGPARHLWTYRTPDGFDDLRMVEEGGFLTGLWFAGSRDGAGQWREGRECRTAVLEETCRWLDRYFEGRDPGFMPPVRMEGLTPFRAAVVEAMLDIPFGRTATYGGIADALARKRGIAKMSAQAVGGAVGWNPVCIIVPCHRVVGAAGNLTGYGGGLRNKTALLAHEGVDLSGFFLPAAKAGR